MIPFGKKIRSFAGGAFSKLFKKKGKVERHHMPSRKSLNESGLDDVNPNTDAPAIEMDRGDHVKTGSWGSGTDSKKFRKKEKELLNKGDFEGAQQLGIDDVRKRHGKKYDSAINQMLDYTKQLFKKKKGN